MTGSTNVIEREIEEARAGMTRAAAEIERRLQPETLVDSALGLFQRNGPARAIVDEVTDLALRNPVPVLMIGLGLAWLALDFSRHRPPAPRRTAHTDQPVPPAGADGPVAPTADTILGLTPSHESAAMAAHVFADAGMGGAEGRRL
ncbi:DUF3618 domain-containing protein [Niveispirillum sp. BGYR6]|uniref:DUF3618 domain-containing protein n=1 Tax=Niveispirillum sp. BGYR6 TaxID=2971249 RepID=UPI0022B941CB|nr:DUF3618 domain-containing protein [Niveispirillum sp. BGYR6]MDG5495103.1 DUF3618 domain-containing protein [Niveispirillum sp. BGYR6]